MIQHKSCKILIHSSPKKNKHSLKFFSGVLKKFQENVNNNKTLGFHISQNLANQFQLDELKHKYTISEYNNIAMNSKNLKIYKKKIKSRNSKANSSLSSSNCSTRYIMNIKNEEKRLKKLKEIGGVSTARFGHLKHSRIVQSISAKKKYKEDEEDFINRIKIANDIKEKRSVVKKLDFKVKKQDIFVKKEALAPLTLSTCRNDGNDTSSTNLSKTLPVNQESESTVSVNLIKTSSREESSVSFYTTKESKSQVKKKIQSLISKIKEESLCHRKIDFEVEGESSSGLGGQKPEKKKWDLDSSFTPSQNPCLSPQYSLDPTPNRLDFIKKNQKKIKIYTPVYNSKKKWKCESSGGEGQEMSYRMRNREIKERENFTFTKPQKIEIKEEEPAQTKENYNNYNRLEKTKNFKKIDLETEKKSMLRGRNFYRQQLLNSQKQKKNNVNIIDLKNLLQNMVKKKKEILSFELEMPIKLYKDSKKFKESIMNFFNDRCFINSTISQKYINWRSCQVYWLKKFKLPYNRKIIFLSEIGEFSGFSNDKVSFMLTGEKKNRENNELRLKICDNRNRKILIRYRKNGKIPKKMKIKFLRKNEKPCLFYLEESMKYLKMVDFCKRQDLEVTKISKFEEKDKSSQISFLTVSEEEISHNHKEKTIENHILDFKLTPKNLIILFKEKIKILCTRNWLLSKEIPLKDPLIASYFVGRNRMILVPKKGKVFEVYNLISNKSKFISMEKFLGFGGRKTHRAKSKKKLKFNFF